MHWDTPVTLHPSPEIMKISQTLQYILFKPKNKLCINMNYFCQWKKCDFRRRESTMSTYPAPAPGRVRCPAPPRTGAPHPPPLPPPQRRRPPTLEWVPVCWNKFKWVSLVRMDLRDLSNFQVRQFQPTGWLDKTVLLRPDTLKGLLRINWTFKNCDYIFVCHPLSDS